MCSNPAALTTQSCLEWCYVEPVCFVELFNILISTLFIQKKFLLTEHWTHKAINSLPSHGSLFRCSDMLCRTKDLIFGENNLLECFSFFFSFLSSHLLITVLTCEGKQWVTLLLSVKTQIRRMHLHLHPLQNCFPSNVQSIQHDCLFFLPVCFALVSLGKSRNRVHSLWIPHLVWCLMEIQNTDDGSSQRVQVQLAQVSRISLAGKCINESFSISTRFRRQFWAGGCLCARWFVSTQLY